MKNNNNSTTSNWPNIAMIAGGVLMAILWPLFITLHGPTSFDQDGSFLGGGVLFWGMMMNAPASLLFALGLVGHYRLLSRDAGWLAKVGIVLTLIGLVIPALVDIATVAIGSPLLMPLTIAGLMMLAAGNRKNPVLPKIARRTLLGLGVLLLLAFPMFLIPLEIFDQIEGYRIYGILAHLLFGAGWILLGFSLMKINQAARTEIPRT
jgi:hypothetical protein